MDIQEALGVWEVLRGLGPEGLLFAGAWWLYSRSTYLDKELEAARKDHIEFLQDLVLMQLKGRQEDNTDGK